MENSKILPLFLGYFLIGQIISVEITTDTPDNISTTSNSYDEEASNASNAQNDFLVELVRQHAGTIKKILASSDSNVNDNDSDLMKSKNLPPNCIYPTSTDSHLDLTSIVRRPINSRLHQNPPFIRPTKPQLPSLFDVIKSHHRDTILKNYYSAQKIKPSATPLRLSQPAQSQISPMVLPRPLIVHKTVLPNGRTMYYTYGQVMPSTSPIRDALSTPPTTETTPSSTTSKPSSTYPPLAPGEPVYERKIKFVLPYPLPNPKPLSKFPWEIDPYAYYPSEIRPKFMNVPAPYKPVYHMIRLLEVPNDHLTSQKSFNKSQLSDVSLQ